MPLVLNSSCWLEFFADTDRAGLCAEVIEHAQDLEVPVLTVYEVAKTLVREAGDDVAAGALSLMHRDKVINNDRQPDPPHRSPPRPRTVNPGHPL